MKPLAIIALFASILFKTNIVLPSAFTPTSTTPVVPAVEAQQASQPAYPRTIGQYGGVCINNRTNEPHTNILVTAQETTDILLQAGFTGEQTRIMTAISHAESGSDLACWGDENLQNNTWRESYGLFQIRLLRNPNGSCRDYELLKENIFEQAKCAKQIYDSQGYPAWSVYTNGKYRQWLDQTW